MLGVIISSSSFLVLHSKELQIVNFLSNSLSISSIILSLYFLGHFLGVARTLGMFILYFMLLYEVSLDEGYFYFKI